MTSSRWIIDTIDSSSDVFQRELGTSSPLNKSLISPGIQQYMDTGTSSKLKRHLLLAVQISYRVYLFSIQKSV